jgi:hypothetical protein
MYQVKSTFILQGEKYRRNSRGHRFEKSIADDLIKKDLIITEETQEKYSEAVCIASGGSLTKEDCEIARQWLEQKEDRVIITVNTSYRIAPFAAYLYACDRQWWAQNHKQVKKNFKGRLFTHCKFPDVEHAHCKDYRNSGANAIALAARMGCKKIYLLGYDCSLKNGYHWHGKHGGKFKDCKSIERWPKIFQDLANEHKEIEIKNLSRHTELTCFERAEVEKCLII